MATIDWSTGLPRVLNAGWEWRPAQYNEGNYTPAQYMRREEVPWYEGGGVNWINENPEYAQNYPGDPRFSAWGKPTFQQLQDAGYGDITNPTGKFWSQLPGYYSGYVTDPSHLVEQAGSLINWPSYQAMTEALGPAYAREVQGAAEAAARNSAPGFIDKLDQFVLPAVGAALFGPALMAGVGAEAAGGATAAAGGASAGGSTALGTGIASGAGGVTGITPGAGGITGLTATAPAGTAFAPGFFGAETLSIPGAALGTGITPGAGGATGLTPGVSSSGIGGGELGSGLTTSAGEGAFTLGPWAGPKAVAGGAGALTPMVGTDSILDKASAALPGALSNPSLLGALGGGLLGGLGGGSKPAGTITVEEGIPDWLQPYVKPQLDKYSTLVQNYNTDPYGVMPAAMQEFQKTISGGYLDPSTNKYLEDYFRLGAERVKGSLSPSFGYMQAFGNHSGYNEALSRGLSDLAVGLYGGAYEKERNRQYGAMGQAPNFLGGASQAAFAPYQGYLGTVGSLGRKKEEPYFSNPFASMLGGALTGYGLGSIFK